MSLSFPFFILISPRTPRSTLFPYTTLFRSLGAKLLGGLKALVGVDRERLHHDIRHAAGAERLDPNQRLDRKSTRLNSSHRCISYAVFCLKKKKKASRPYIRLRGMMTAHTGH